MSAMSKRIASERMRRRLDEVGGEALEGSGFENETPEEGFSPATLFELAVGAKDMESGVRCKPLTNCSLKE